MTPEKQLPEEKNGGFASVRSGAEENRPAEDWAALDQELAQMAQDAPDVPDDFHARWTQQIRAEAGQALEKARAEKRRQGRYLLSAAAVFVFLIGGTLLTRTLKAGTPAAREAGAFKAADIAAENTETAWTADLAAGMAAENDENAALTMMAAEPAYETAEEAAEADAWAAEAAVNSFMDTTAEEETDEAAAAPAAAEGGAASLQSKKNALPAAPRLTEMPMPQPTAAPTASPAPEPSGEAAPAEESPFVSFLKDLGIFTLKTLGACILPALAAALVLRRRRKK